MSLPMPLRKKDIESKLAYAERRLNEFSTSVLSDKLCDKETEFFSHTASEIISIVSEVFDYLGKDIFEAYLCNPNSQGKKVNSYFPFSRKTFRGNLQLQRLKETRLTLYLDLAFFVESIEFNRPIPDTMIPYVFLSQAREMVNEKKHDRVLPILQLASEELVAQSEGIIFSLNRGYQKGWSFDNAEFEGRKSFVAGYRFEFNGEEVIRFCQFSLNGARRVIFKFYSDHFS